MFDLISVTVACVFPNPCHQNWSLFSSVLRWLFPSMLCSRRSHDGMCHTWGQLVLDQQWPPILISPASLIFVFFCIQQDDVSRYYILNTLFHLPGERTHDQNLIIILSRLFSLYQVFLHTLVYIQNNITQTYSNTQLEIQTTKNVQTKYDTIHL